MSDGLFLEEKKKLVRGLFTKGITILNKEVNIPQFQHQYAAGENRTLELNIAGLQDLDTGLVFENGVIRTFHRLKDKPTFKVYLDEDTFIALLQREIKFEEAYFYGYLKVEGENFLRDIKIFQRIFDEYSFILEKLSKN